MRDIDVRQALRSQRLRRYYLDPKSRIVEEFGIRQGTCRIDVAVINGSLHGFEIKSEADTLDRLDQQAEAYGRVFDRMTLVASERHIEAAQRRIPDWWAIDLVVQRRSEFRLLRHRRGRLNADVDPYELAQLLWKEEALRLLADRGLDRGLRSRTRAEIWRAVTRAMPLARLRRSVRDILRTREAWRVPVPQP